MRKKENLQMIIFLIVLTVALVIAGKVDQDFLAAGMMY